MPPGPVVLASSAATPLVDRDRERATLIRALEQAVQGRGSTWLLEGDGGIGKTRLARWVEEEAAHRGFRVRSGYCMKEVSSAFFSWNLIFRPTPSRGVGPGEGGASRWAPVVLLGEDRAGLLWERVVAASAGGTRVLVVSRERAASIRQRVPNLPEAVQLLHLSRIEGPDGVQPGHLDAVADRAGAHLRGAPGGVVAVPGLEYLVSQNSFLPVLRFVQYLREVAEETGSHVLLSFRPDALEPRERALLEAEGEVETPPDTAPPVSGGLPPARVFLQYLDVIARETQEGPLLLFIDDLQWADPPSVLAFQFLARNIRDYPALLLGTVRGDEVRPAVESEESVLPETLEKMAGEGTVTRLRLEGLEEADALTVMNDLLPAPLEAGGQEAHLRGFLQRSGGNPYLVLSTARLLAEGGWFQQEEGRVLLAVPEGEELPKVLPDSVAGAVRRRFTMLLPEERALLEVGAVGGREFDPAAVAAVLHRPEAEIERVAWKLQAVHQFLFRIPGPGGRGGWAFTHPLTWEAILGAVPETERCAHAAALAKWWEENRPQEVETVARLWYEAGEAARGLPWIDRALREAERAHAAGIVDRYGRWRLESQQRAGTPVDEQVRCGLSLLRLLVRLGAQRAASRWGERMVRLAPEGELLWEARIRATIAMSWVDVPHSRALLDRLREDVGKAGSAVPERLRGLLRYGEGNLLSLEGRSQDALDAALQGLTLLRPTGDPEDLCHVLYLAGFGLLTRGRLPEAVPLIAEGLGLARKEGLGQSEARLRNARGYASQCEGDLKGACNEFALSASLFREAGNLSHTSMMMSNLGGELTTLEDWDRAGTSLREAQALARKAGDAMGASAALHNLGRLYAMQGRWTDALASLSASLTLRRQLGFLADVAELLSLLVEVHARLGEYDEAASLAVQAEASAREGTREAQVAALRAKGVLGMLQGHPEEARAALQEALEQAERTAAWGDKVRTWSALFELEQRGGRSEAAKMAWEGLNESRGRIGLPPVPPPAPASRGP